MGPLEGDEVMRVESYDGNSAFIKGAPESSFAPLPLSLHEDTARREPADCHSLDL